MKLVVKDRKERELASLDVDPNTTVGDFKKQMQGEFKKSKKNMYPDRQRYTIGLGKGATALKGGKLSDYDLNDGSVLYFKDLGAQVSYKMVFIIEYLGPMLIWFIVDEFYRQYYGVERSQAQMLLTVMWHLHYIKRELETLFVHRFSHATMPLFPNLPRNCAHYWGAGLYISVFVLSPSHVAVIDEKTPYFVGFWALFEVCNLISHIQLRNLRKPGSTERKIPRGFLFEFVSCPNYTCEILGWVFFSLIAVHWSSWLFTVVGAGQMYIWAAQKHRAYKKDFPDYPKSRKIIVPFIL